MEEKIQAKNVLRFGLLLAAVNLGALLSLLVLDHASGLKILSMIAAAHIGGRLAIIGAGLELEFGPLVIMSVTMLYNTMFVLIVFSLFVMLFRRASKFEFIARIHRSANEARQLRNNWNHFSIIMFILIPLPMTGAMMGTLIAYFEGYPIRKTLLIALPSMWFGVITNTIAFDFVYQSVRQVSPTATLIITVALLSLPLLYGFFKRKKQVERTDPEEERKRKRRGGSLKEKTIINLAFLSPRLISGLLEKLIAVKWINRVILKPEEKKLDRLKKVRKLLVVSDTNIGDAVLFQSVFAKLDHLLPDTEFHFIYQKRAEALVKHNPYIDAAYPVYVDTNFNSESNNSGVKEILEANDYDLIVNFYPFFTNGEFETSPDAMLSAFKLVSDIINTKNGRDGIPHVMLQLDRFFCHYSDMLTQNGQTPAIEPFAGNELFLPRDVAIRARKVLRALDIPSTASIAFVNPDTSSRFTKPPDDMLHEIVKGLLKLDRYDTILIGPGFTFEGAEQRLCESIPEPLRKNRIRLLPKDIAIDTYAGVMDQCDLVITGDTAQMHIAAARKVCIDGNGTVYRNRTAMVNLIGSTNARIYGYDSTTGIHLPANQDAPSKVFEGAPACKNLTCIHKKLKDCEVVLCFEGVESRDVLAYIETELTALPAVARAVPA
ncbi:hypothetical protein GF324_09110 [bacterium]|nr:hypothetical protein [bacterium]